MKRQFNDKLLSLLFETDTEWSEWFGYYNYDVINKNGKYMLCNRVSFDGRGITSEDSIELGYYDITTGEWHHIDYSKSFNWQQGAMLQWMPNEDNKVIYNISKDGHYKSVIAEIDTGSKKVIDFPTYCVTPDGRFSISLNYERSYWCRAYHYQPIKNPKYDVQIAEDDGIFKVDLINNTYERIVDIHDVIALDSQKDFETAKHWLEHIMINKAGDRIAFLHRYSYGTAYSTRLLICDINGNELCVVPGWKENDWSHFGWKGNREFVIYSVKRNAFQANYTKSVQKAKNRFSPIVIINWAVHLPVLRVIKDRLKPSQRYYKLYKEENGKFTFVRNLDQALFSIDGHPSFTDDGIYMITDSYPDQEGFQRLMIFDCNTNKGVILGKFAAPLQGNPASCDLHPKLCFNGKYIVIDTAYSGKHRMIAFQINWDAVMKTLQ